MMMGIEASATSVSVLSMENMNAKDKTIKITMRKTDVSCSDTKF